VQHRDLAARFGALHTHPLYPRVPQGAGGAIGEFRPG
jgi:hypothetical protein